MPSVWEINIQRTKLHLDLVFFTVSFAVMEEPTVFVSEHGLRTAEKRVIINLLVSESNVYWTVHH